MNRMLLVHNNKYKISDKKLGTGGFSEVFLGIDTQTNKYVAIKKVALVQKNLEQQLLEKLQFEIELMQKLNHPNIVLYHDVVKTDTHWYIIMEYCNAGTLSDVIKYSAKLEDSDREIIAHYYLVQLKDAIACIRSLGYVHRDIKPMNVLLMKSVENMESMEIMENMENMENTKSIYISNIPIDFHYNSKLIVKLADFGLAKSSENDDLMTTMCGSPLYMAPELFFDSKYNSKTDLWAYGTIMYEMLFGEHPNAANTYEQLVKNLKTKNIKFHFRRNFSKHCFDLMMNLLVNDPKKRIEWDVFFNHIWFQNWNSESNKISTIMTPPQLTLGNSNLSKMKQNKFLYPSPHVRGSYSEYPSSYPPADPRRQNLRYLMYDKSRSSSLNTPPSLLLLGSYGNQTYGSRNNSFIDSKSVENVSISSGSEVNRMENRMDNRGENKMDLSKYIIPNYEDSSVQHKKSEPIAIKGKGFLK